MQVPGTLKRLHALRGLEEHQRSAELERAKAELCRLRSRLDSLRKRHQKARALLSASVVRGAIEDRLAALEEIATLERQATGMTDKISAAEQLISHARSQLLSKRLERRQMEILVDAEKTQCDKTEYRRNQQSLDEWFRLRRP